MKKLSVILAVVIAVVLLVTGAFLGFDRASDVGGTYVLTVNLNEKFEIADIEAIMKEAGATGCFVQKQYKQVSDGFNDAGIVVINFEVLDDSQIQAVYEKAENLLGEKYFLKYPGELTNFSSTLNKAEVISMWPAIIIAVVMLAYVFIRFKAKMGICALINMFVAGGATLGLIGIIGIKVTGYTIPAILLTCALAYGFTVIFALILSGNVARLDSKEEAISATVKQNNGIVAVLSAIAAIAFAVVLILGGTMLANFAITALIGIVINAAVAILVMPEMLFSSKKA